nr:MFS transporter [Devriesea agamarum]
MSRRSVFWAGQSLSIVCDQAWAFLWALVFLQVLHVSEDLFGLANSAEYAVLAVVPLFLAPFFAGRQLIAVLSWLDLARALLTVTVAAALLFQWINVLWALSALLLMSSLAGLFHNAFYAVLPDIAGRSDVLTRDNARLSTLISTGGVVMPVIAASLATAVAPGMVLLVIAMAYLLSFLTLRAVNHDDPRQCEGAGPAQKSSYRTQLAHGFRVVLTDRLVASATALSATFNVVEGMAATIMPILILKVWGLSSGLFAVFTSSAAVGGILGGIVAGSMTNRLGIVRSLHLSTAAAGLLFTVMGWVAAQGASAFGVLICLEALVMVVAVIFNVANGTLRQVVVPGDVLAQTFSTVRVVAALGSAVGAAAGGALASIGSGWIGLMCGGIAAGMAALLARRVLQLDRRVESGALKV